MRSLTWVALVILFAACGDRGRSRPDDSTVAAPADSPAPAPAIALPLRALGTEPFWALDIDSAGLHFITPEDTSGIRFPPVVSSVAGDTVVWASQSERAAIEVRVWRGECSDGMSDRVYPHAAIVMISGTAYRGCADKRP